jgi:hypothetical protein
MDQSSSSMLTKPFRHVPATPLAVRRLGTSMGNEKALRSTERSAIIVV